MEDTVEIVDADIVEQRRHDDADIVHQHPHRQLGRERGEGRLRRIAVRKIDHPRVRAQAFRLRFDDVENDDPEAVSLEAERDGLADIAPATGDDGTALHDIISHE